MSKELVPLGKLIKKDKVEETERDAFHIAIVPVKASETLCPGAPISLLNDDKIPLVKIDRKNPVGIVDPFLKRLVEKDEYFYLCLFPNTVTGMRHHWEHPLFKQTENSKTESILYLEDISSRLGMHYDVFINGIDRGYINFSYDVPEWLYDEKESIIKHYNKTMGRNKTSEDLYFSCAC